MAQFERIRAEVENFSGTATSPLATSSSLRSDPLNALPTPEPSESQSERRSPGRQGGDLARRRRAQELSREVSGIRRGMEAGLRQGIIK